MFPLYLKDESHFINLLFAIVWGKNVSEEKKTQMMSKTVSYAIHNKSKHRKAHMRSFCLKDFEHNLVYDYSGHKIISFVNVTNLLLHIFSCDKHEILHNKAKIDAQNDLVIYKSFSLCPVTYNFHISFWVMNNIDLKKFKSDFRIITLNIGQHSIKDYHFLSTYEDELNSRKSITFVILYCSYIDALSKDKAKTLHNKIGKTVEKYLGCVYRC